MEASLPCETALAKAKVLYEKPGEVQRYVTVDAEDLLQYVAANHVSCLCYLDIGGADGLAVLVTQFVQACLRQSLGGLHSSRFILIM